MSMDRVLLTIINNILLLGFKYIIFYYVTLRHFVFFFLYSLYIIMVVSLGVVVYVRAIITLFGTNDL